MRLAPHHLADRTAVRRAIERLRSTHTRPVVVALDGGSGAGKSTLAAWIAHQFDAALIPLDDFFAADIPDSQWDRFTIQQRLAHVFDWARVRGEMVAATQALAADGTPLAQLSPQEGDAFCMAQLPLPARRRVPDDPQPPRRVSRMSYLISDLALPAITRQVYRREARQAWGPHMAPLDAGDRRSRAWIALGAALAFIAGLWLGRRRSNR